jgi:hypothetical protein
MYVSFRLLLFLSVSLFDLKTRFSVPTRAGAKTPGADAVKAHRRDALATRSPVSRWRLDGGEHGVRLPAVGTRSGGAF